MHENIPIYSQSIAFLSMSICFTPHDIAWHVFIYEVLHLAKIVELS